MKCSLVPGFRYTMLAQRKQAPASAAAATVAAS